MLTRCPNNAQEYVNQKVRQQFKAESKQRLEAEDLVLQLRKALDLLESDAGGCLPHGANHGQWAAEEELHVRSWGRELLLQIVSAGSSSGILSAYLNHVGGHEANTSGPALWRVVENVVDTEIGVSLGQFIEILLQDDVLNADIRENEINLGLVLGVRSDGADNLQHRSNTGSTSNHAKPLDEARGIDKLALGAADIDGFANLKGRNVLGDVAGRV